MVVICPLVGIGSIDLPKNGSNSPPPSPPDPSTTASLNSEGTNEMETLKIYVLPMSQLIWRPLTTDNLAISVAFRDTLLLSGKK